MNQRLTCIRLFPLFTLAAIALDGNAEGFVSLANTGWVVCDNGNDGGVSTNCRINGSLPTGTSCAAATAFGGSSSGVTGVWYLFRQANSNAIRPRGDTDVSVGNLEDRIWRRCTAVGGTTTSDYIFGMRASLNTTDWTEPADDNLGLPGNQGCNGEVAPAFEVNDLTRRGFAGVTSLAVAYRPGSGDGNPVRVARSCQTLAEILPLGGNATTPPTPNLDCVTFRVDISAEDLDGSSTPASAWLLVKATLATPPGASRLKDTILATQAGDMAQCRYRASNPGYRP